MSKIFDFLKQTETERSRKSPIPEWALELPKAETTKAEDRTAEVVEEPSPIEVEICRDDKFDLTQASPQVRSVLDPLTLVGEQFRLLRSRLSLMQKQRGIRTVLITSSIPEEGKTFTASGLAGVFAQEPGKRVLLIDADLRKPRSGWNLGLNGSAANTGLSEVLRGNIQFHNALLMSTNPEFYFLPSGPLPSNPSELLGTSILERILKTAAESFDWVILDSPPVISLSDTALLSSLCDTVVLVVRANSTPSKLITTAVNRIGRDRICGVVINRQKQIQSSRYYYKYYASSSKLLKKNE